MCAQQVVISCSIVGTFCIRNKQNIINLTRIFRKMVTSGFKRKNVPQEYMKARKKARSKKSKQNVPVPDDF